MSDEKRFEGFSDEELFEELARRRANKLQGKLGQAEQNLMEQTAQGERRALQLYLERCSATETDRPRRCPRCGGQTPVKARARQTQLRALGGLVTFERHYYYCTACRHGFYPLDEELGLPQGGKLTPEMERRLLDLGVNSPAEEAAARFEVHYTGSVSAHLIEKVLIRQAQPLVDATPDDVQRALTPVTRCNQERTIYVEVDGSGVDIRGTERGREVKLGVIFDDSHHSRGTVSRRGLITQARYVAEMDGLEAFEAQMKAALRCEGTSAAGRVVWLGDGASWIWGMASRLTDNAVEVLDWYHAIEAAFDCAGTVMERHHEMKSLFVDRLSHLLWNDGPDAVLAELEQCLFQDLSERDRKAIRSLHRYYSTHKTRMDYPSYLRDELMIGSGAIEAGHRHVLQTRMKRAGMHWSFQGAQRMAKLRAFYQTAGPSKFYDTLQRVA
ncbi:MAG: ISKra4 family transposase [Myxococcota bacterium]